MTKKSEQVLKALAGKTLATAESLTGGGIGAGLTAVAGSSAVYKGGIICYCDEVKQRVLGVQAQLLESLGAVSGPVAEAMAAGARKLCLTDIAVSVTGLAGPGADAFGNPVGTVFIGYADEDRVISRRFLFSGDREAVRTQTVDAALELIMEYNAEKVD